MSICLSLSVGCPAAHICCNRETYQPVKWHERGYHPTHIIARKYLSREMPGQMHQPHQQELALPGQPHIHSLGKKGKRTCDQRRHQTSHPSHICQTETLRGRYSTTSTGIPIFRSGITMTLHFTGAPRDPMKNIECWPSETFALYIHKQIGSVTAGWEQAIYTPDPFP